MKPVCPETLAEIAGQLRHLAALIEDLAGTPAVGDSRLRVDLRALTVTWQGQSVIGLTAAETQLVAFLARRPGIIRSRAEILDHLAAEEPCDRAVDVKIRRIRRAFEAVDPDFKAIGTTYGVGYSWRD